MSLSAKIPALRWIAACLAAAAVGSVRAQDALTLIEKGEARCIIVLPADAGPSEKWAAEQLQWHLKQMSGADVPVEDAPREGLTPVLLGSAAKAALGKVDFEALGSDGFVIDVTDRVAIAGSRKRGTMYGVFALLEKLGCRWWTPTESTIPQTETIEMPRMHLREVPRLEYRDIMYREVQPSGGPAGPIWMARNKVNGMVWQDVPEKLGGRYRFGGRKLAHTLTDLLKKHKIEITPEMMAMDARGRRAAPGRRGSQLCFSSQAAVQAMTEAVVKEYEQSPDVRFVVVGQEDGYGYCRCEKCGALAEKEGSQSGPLLHFINQVAEQAEKQVPRAAVATNAYVWSRKPPAHVRPRDNVYIVMASYECDFGHPMATSVAQAGEWGSVSFRKDLEGWQKIAPKMFVWDYSTNFLHYLMPYPNLDVLAPNMKYYADHGVAGVMPQGAWGGYGSEFAHLRMWVLARAMWNPDADNQALITEFLDGYYGPAAPAILEYIEVMHRYVRENLDFVLGIYRHINVPYIAPRIVAEAEAALRTADAAVAGEGEDLERRVRHAHMPVWYLLAKFGPGSKMWRETEAKVGELSMAEIAERFGRVVTEYKINELGEGQPGKAWFQWLQDYARIVAERGVPLPEQLEGADPRTYRLIQACQMDRGAAWYLPQEEATDGWAVRPPRGRQTLHYLSDTNDFTPGRRYRAFVRVRGEGVTADAKGEVWTCGLRGGPTITLTADQLRDGKWHTFELGEVKPQGIGVGLWTGLLYKYRDKIKAVSIDCMWLRELAAEGRNAG